MNKSLLFLVLVTFSPVRDVAQTLRHYTTTERQAWMESTVRLTAKAGNGQFPRRLATQDYMIQEPRYLQAYADMFCRFIKLYREENVPIDMVMYQNEAYSYTPYPGCAWTPEGSIRFNRDFHTFTE